MSTAQAVRASVHKLPKGHPFTRDRFLNKHRSRAAVDRSLSRLVAVGEIERVAHGVYVRPGNSRFVGTVSPDVLAVVKAIAQRNGETIQIHGAEALRRFGLSTQVPMAPVFLTSASSRSIQIGNITVKMIHTSNRRRLQFAGEPAGAALAALWYLGNENVSREAVATIEAALGPAEFERLYSADVPAWMGRVLDAPNRAAVGG